MVDIAMLLKSVGSIAWKAGVVCGPGVVHTRTEAGDHVITITVPKMLAEWKEPETRKPTWNYPSAGWDDPKRGK